MHVANFASDDGHDQKPPPPLEVVSAQSDDSKASLAVLCELFDFDPCVLLGSSHRYYLYNHGSIIPCIE